MKQYQLLHLKLIWCGNLKLMYIHSLFVIKAFKSYFHSTCLYRQSAEVQHIVESPSQEDEGNYTCTAISSAGAASSTVFLDVKGEWASWRVL